MTLDRVRAVVAIARDILLIALMLAFVFLGARVIDAVHDATEPHIVTPATLPDDRCGGGVC